MTAACFDNLSTAEEPNNDLVPIAKLMPRSEDFTSMWWLDGAPNIVTDASARRIVRTGHYWFNFDNNTVSVPRIGAATSPLGELGGADLELTATVAGLDGADGKTYRCVGSEAATRFTGPRIIESGRFLQRADVTGLIFEADDGTRLNTKARLETAAWPNRLAMMLTAEPGRKKLVAGENSFGHTGGGFGFDGTNELAIPAADAETPEKFTLEFQTYLPREIQTSKRSPWLVCAGRNTNTAGHYGISISREGKPTAYLNIEGGGGQNIYRAISDSPLQFESWNHIAISYDGQTFRLYGNGKLFAETKVGKTRVPKPNSLTFGSRGDDRDGSYRFKGIIDDVKIFGSALALNELRKLRANPARKIPQTKPIHQWDFRQDIPDREIRGRDQWQSAAIAMKLTQGSRTLESTRKLTKWPTNKETSDNPEERAFFAFDPVTFENLTSDGKEVVVKANNSQGGRKIPVEFDEHLSCYRIQINDCTPVKIPGASGNDSIERVLFSISNRSQREKAVGLLFEKTKFNRYPGVPITGVSAILRDLDGNPIGVPVQLSKNWHQHPLNDAPYEGPWFHGISQLTIPPGGKIELELTLAFGHWGGVPAASHSQLSLIGWGGNGRWDQTALGSWGESICFDPEQSQAKCSVTDVRPVLVTSRKGEQWDWTQNVGGGDFFRLFNTENQRIGHASMQARYDRYGPCLTDVTYFGRFDNAPIGHRETVSLTRSDDYVVGTFEISMKANGPVDFSRFVIFQTGADTYANGFSKKMALGNQTGLVKEWTTQPGDTNPHPARECLGRNSWVSLHQSQPDPGKDAGAWANKGIVIRNWKAKLGGKTAEPWVVESGLERHGKKTSTLDIVPPPGVKRLEKGDFINATIELVILPQRRGDYYGPNKDFQKALQQDGDTWKLMHRQAVQDDRQVVVDTGKLLKRYPDVRVAAKNNEAEFTLSGGLGYVPITIENLTSYKDFVLTVDGEKVDQSMHGNDFWQTDYNAKTKRWSQTYNVPIGAEKKREIRFTQAGDR